MFCFEDSHDYSTETREAYLLREQVQMPRDNFGAKEGPQEKTTKDRLDGHIITHDACFQSPIYYLDSPRPLRDSPEGYRR